MHDVRPASPLGAASAALEPIGPIARAILRCRASEIDRCSDVLGIALPRTACRSIATGDVTALWLGPDEWLLLKPAAHQDWLADIATRVEGTGASLVDVGHRQVALTVSGPCAEDILASGCALDLSIAAFPDGMCTRTMFAKAEIVLWRTAPDRFHLEIWRSFARYVEALIRESEAEYAVK